MQVDVKFKRRPLAVALFSLMAMPSWAQDLAAPAEDAAAEGVEEVVVTGRQQSGAQAVFEERLEQPFAAELLDAEQIIRTGDSNVSIALTRVTGVTLLDNKYVYVRGLGERYSSTLLNGASVPSPELTRNVLPLDMIPSSVVQTLKVQKAYSADLPAHFGGGTVDVRTKTVPEEFLWSASLGTGTNFSGHDGLTYASQGRPSALPKALLDGVKQYQGNISINNIADILDTDGGSPTAAELKNAEGLNRELAVALNRSVEIRHQRLAPDRAASMSLGDAFELTDDLTLGAQVNYSHDSKWRNKDQVKRSVGSPDDNRVNIRRSSEDSRTLAALIVGAKYQDEHSLQASYYDISSVQDEARISEGFDGSNYTPEKGLRSATYDTRYEDRQLEVAQISAEHQVPFLSWNFLQAPSLSWFYSDAQARNDIPNRTSIRADDTLDIASGKLVSSQLSPAASMATFEFLNLRDDVESFGWDAKAPLAWGDRTLDLTGGYRYNDKIREYYGYTASLSARGNSTEVLSGGVSRVLSDSHLRDLNNRFELTMGGGFGTESYIAAEITKGSYGQFDLKWNEAWRVTGGVRYETHTRALLPVDLLDYSGQWVQKLNRDLVEKPESFARIDDGWYPALAVTHSVPEFMGAETFQLRGSFSQTTVRPDLREMSDVSYVDTEINKRVRGNPNLKASNLDHFDIRAEWLYEDGDNMTATVFYKNVKDPIESTNLPGSDDDVILTFENALDGSLYGVELEGLKNLPYGFFISGNLTLSDSQITSPDGVGYTNAERPMTGQSQYVVNTQLGFDSEDERHSAALVYNYFGERLFFAARSVGGYQDAYEQPFHSLDATYSFFFDEQLSFKVKMANLLDQERSFEQEDLQGRAVEILRQSVGTSLSADVKFTY
jgi:TonB-dependent receptor